MSEQLEFTHVTPSGVKVRIVSQQRNGFVLMSNGAIIDNEILAKWQKASNNARPV
jgi:hypothetical protein